MNPFPRAAALALALALAGGPAVAHGDEPHGDAPHPPAEAAPAADAARFEAATPLFEVVGRLGDDALRLHVARFATSEPVERAEVEVELDALSARAAWRADHGDYVVDDAALVAALRRPGQHALVLTVTAGDDADLLDAALSVAPPQPGAGPAGVATPARLLAAGAAVVAAAVALGAWLRRRARRAPGAAA